MDIYDPTVRSVLGLYEQKLSVHQISRRLGISSVKVRKILITAGLLETPNSAYASKRIAEGAAINDIAQELGISVKALNGHLPYSKVMYGTVYPSKNALIIRKHRSKISVDCNAEGEKHHVL